MKQNEELEPCPFCGGDPIIKGNKKLLGIVCDREPCLGSGLLFSFTPENKCNAIKAWNTRHQPEQQSERTRS